MRMACNPRSGQFDVFLPSRGTWSATYEVGYRTSDGDGHTRDASNTICRGTGAFPPIPSNVDFHGGPATSNESTLASLRLMAALNTDYNGQYRITLDGEQTYDGHRVYRLAFDALYDPQQYPLKVVLVDEDSYLIRQAYAEYSRHGALANGKATATLSFERVGNYWAATDFAFSATVRLFVLYRMHFDASVHTSSFDFTP
jgi:hypothetical protein